MVSSSVIDLLPDPQGVHSPSAVAWTRLLEIRNRLRLEKCRTGKLKPSDTVNQIFTELVNFCVHTASPIEDSLMMSLDTEFDKMVLELREYAAEGETHLEKYWAQKLITENLRGQSQYRSRRRLLNFIRNSLVINIKPKYPLEKFVYYQNYVDLARLELNALFSVMRKVRPSFSINSKLQLRLAFIGSGPMPLSSLELGIQASGDISLIHNIDSDDEAIQMSIQLSKIFSFGNDTNTKYTFQCSDIRDMTCLRQFDIVYVASLVGSNNQEKEDILGHLNKIMRVGAYIVVRTVRGLRQLLYPKVTMAQVRLAGFAELLEVHPYGGDGVVNSVLVAVKVQNH